MFLIRGCRLSHALALQWQGALLVSQQIPMILASAWSWTTQPRVQSTNHWSRRSLMVPRSDKESNKCCLPFLIFFHSVADINNEIAPQSTPLPSPSRAIIILLSCTFCAGFHNCQGSAWQTSYSFGFPSRLYQVTEFPDYKVCCRCQCIY